MNGLPGRSLTSSDSVVWSSSSSEKSQAVWAHGMLEGGGEIDDQRCDTTPIYFAGGVASKRKMTV